MDAPPREPTPDLITRRPYATSRTRRYVYAIWEALASRRLASLLLLLALYFMLFLFRGVRWRDVASPGLSLVRLQLAFTLERFRSALVAHAGGDAGQVAGSQAVRALVGELLGVDVWFALVVGLFVASVAALLTIGTKRTGPESRWMTAAAASVLLPFVAVLADWTENVCQALLLRGLINQGDAGGAAAWLVGIASLAALLKFGLPVAAILIAVTVWLRLRRSPVDAASTSTDRDQSAPAAEGPSLDRVDQVVAKELDSVIERRGAAVAEIRGDLEARPAAHWTDSKNANERLQALLQSYDVECGSGFDEEPHDCAVGLAFSGGGIRSATFNLGLVQALSRVGILPFVDYLSSVSGGGFPAACMTSLLSMPGPAGRESTPAFGTTWRRFPLNPDLAAFAQSGDTWLPCTDRGRNVQLDDLRNMGNYLVPRPRPLGRDTLRGVGAVIVGIVYTATLFLLLLFAGAAFVYLTAASLSSNVLLNRVAVVGVAQAILSSVRPTADPRWALLLASITLVAGVLFAWMAAWLLSRRYQRAPDEDGWTTSVSSEGQSLAEHRDAFYIALFGLGFAVSLELCIGLLIRMDALVVERVASRLAESFDAESGAHQLLLRLDSTLAPLHAAGSSSGHSFWIWTPMLFAVGCLLGLVAFRLLGRTYVERGSDRQPVWGKPDFRTISWSAQGVALYGVGLALLFALLAVPHFYAVVPGETSADGAGAASPLALAILSGAASAALAYVEAKKSSYGAKASKALDATSGVRNALLGLLLIVLLVATLFFFMSLIDQVAATVASPLITMNLLVWAVGLPVALFFLIGRLVNLNYVSPHYFTRDRIADTFLKTAVDPADGQVEVVRDDRGLLMSQINSGGAAPYHLVMGTLNLTDSWHLRNKDRRSEPFLFSRRYCGSRSTGFVDTTVFGGGMTRYSRAIAISGAAISSAVGHMTFFAQAFVLTMLNVRLGLWIPNPRGYRRGDAVAAPCEDLGEDRLQCLADSERTAFWPTYLLDEMKGQFSARRKLVNITDGAHTGDNGGLYPLFERRCKVIIAGDASADHGYKFTDLYRVIRQVQTDMGITVEIDVSSLEPTGAEVADGKRMSSGHCAVGRITYPAESPGGAAEYGWLIYFKPAVTARDPARVRQYFATQASFPMPSTADQFFDEYQYEAQRTLGQVTVDGTYQDLLLRRFRKDPRYPGSTMATQLADIVLRRRLAEARTASPSPDVDVPGPQPDQQREAATRQFSDFVGDIGERLQHSKLEAAPEAEPPTDAEVLEALRPGAVKLANRAVELTARVGDWSWEDLPWLEFFAAAGDPAADDMDEAGASSRVGAALGQLVAADFKTALKQLEQEAVREYGVDFLWLGEFPFHRDVMDDLIAETGAAP